MGRHSQAYADLGNNPAFYGKRGNRSTREKISPMNYAEWKGSLKELFKKEIVEWVHYKTSERQSLRQTFMDEHVRGALRAYIGLGADYGTHWREVKGELMGCFSEVERNYQRVQERIQKRILLTLAAEHDKKYQDFYKVGTQID